MERRFYPEQPNGSDLQSLNVGEHNTVSTGGGNNANNCEAAHLWNCMRHSTIEEMINNLLGRLRAQAGNVNVGGHGDSGLFECGSGQDTSYNARTDVYSWNSFVWSGYLSNLKDLGYSIFTIYSCHTGAGEDGADLLFEMANIINKPVRARTGFTVCGDNGIGFPDGTWQIAYPGQRPSPIPKPSAFLSKVRPLKHRYSFSGISVIDIDLHSVSSVRFNSTKKYHAEHRTDGLEAQSLFTALFSGNEYDLGGSPLARRTATVMVTYEQGGAKNTMMFDVFNDIVLMRRGSTIARYVPESLIRSLA